MVALSPSSALQARRREQETAHGVGFGQADRPIESARGLLYTIQLL
jgi:hypothetical protein